MKANVELHIGELILRGLPYAERYRVAAAVEEELKRLLDEAGLPPSLAPGGTVPHVRIDNIRMEAGTKPGVVGEKIAGSIYSSLVGNRPLPGLPGRSTK